MASSLKQKFKNIGPGALVAAGFVGPGTVTTCTVSGASYGYTMLWCLLFATVATIIFQEMASLHLASPPKRVWVRTSAIAFRIRRLSGLQS